MFAILITAETLPLIASMNEGVRPKVENNETYFVYYDHETTPNIISSETLSLLRSQEIWTPLEFVIWQR